MRPANIVMDEKIKTLTITEFNLLANKDPNGSYDRRTRENLQQIIHKLVGHPRTDTDLERRLFYKFRNSKFNDLFGGPPRKPEGKLTQKDMDLARSVQEVTEEIVIKMASYVKKETNKKYSYNLKKKLIFFL